VSCVAALPVMARLPQRVITLRVIVIAPSAIVIAPRVIVMALRAIVMALPAIVLARLVRATSRGTVLVQVARTSRAMTLRGARTLRGWLRGLHQ
jgi:hypothetical protein